MNTHRVFLRPFACAALCVALAVVSGCGLEGTTPPPFVPLKRERVADNITLEVKGEQRRILINAKVCCRDGYLEVFLTRSGPGGKAHESVLVADVDARMIREALLRAKAVPGSPVRVEPYREPRGQTIKVLLQYEEDGKQKIVPGQSWLRQKSGRDVAFEWVFTGSRFVENEFDPQHPTIFLAEAEGTFITVGNLESALLDVNIRSSKYSDEIDLEYNTERIPPVGTKVTVILEPVGVYNKDQN